MVDISMNSLSLYLAQLKPFDEPAQRDQALAEVKRAYNPTGFWPHIAAVAATGDLRLRLANITAPTLVLHGSDDSLVPPEAGKDTAANINGAELLIIEGMGHDLPPSLFGFVAGVIADNARRMSKPVTLCLGETIQSLQPKYRITQNDPPCLSFPSSGS
jgi:pimeloyl-ACP methyl ester carboxylesterase